MWILWWWWEAEDAPWWQQLPGQYKMWLGTTEMAALAGNCLKFFVLASQLFIIDQNHPLAHSFLLGQLYWILVNKKVTQSQVFLSQYFLQHSPSQFVTKALKISIQFILKNGGGWLIICCCKIFSVQTLSEEPRCCQQLQGQWWWYFDKIKSSHCQGILTRQRNCNSFYDSANY